MAETKKKLKPIVNDGGFSSDLYTRIPCTIGYTYMRLEVDGSVRLCCIARHAVGNINHKAMDDIWQSNQAAAFRNKTARINKEHFHLQDPEWGFCQQCSHLQINSINAELLNICENNKDSENKDEKVEL